MAYPTDKPAHNRLTEERVREECASRNHTLLEFCHPFIRVRCHCGNEYEQKIHPYRAAKNSCKECDRRRKSHPRPEHSLVMSGDNNPAKRKEVRQKISEKRKGPRPHLVGLKKSWRPGVLQARSARMSQARRNGSVKSPGNLTASWIPTPEQRLLPGTLYFIRYLDESGIHYKIGITKRSLSERFKPSQLVSILHLHHATLGECFDLEQSLLKWAKSQGYRYSSPTTTELLLPEAIPHLLSTLSKSKCETPEKGKLYRAPH